MITDNLIDLSHVPFLHGGLFGRSGIGPADVTVTQDDSTVTQSRWFHGVPLPSMFAMLSRADGKPVDSWTIMHWRPTGNMILDAKALPYAVACAARALMTSVKKRDMAARFAHRRHILWSCRHANRSHRTVCLRLFLRTFGGGR